MSQCPYCSAQGAYHGLSTVECVNSRCKAYVSPPTLDRCICSACGFDAQALARTFTRKRELTDSEISGTILLTPFQDQGCADPRCKEHKAQATKSWFKYTCRMYVLADLTGYRASPAWPEPFFVELYTTSYTGLRGSKLRLRARNHSNYWDFEF